MNERPKRLRSGIPRLDDILKGGFLRTGIYVVYGPPGGGKTIFANQFCCNHIRLHKGHCLYVTLLTESHGKLVSHMNSLNFFDENFVGEELYYISGYQTLKDYSASGLLELIRTAIRDRKPELLIIDGLEGMDNFTRPQEYKEFLHQLQTFAHISNCTTILLCTSSTESSRRAENTLVDGVIEISDHLIGPRAVRELTVHKFRGGDYLRGRHELEINDGGLQVHPRTEIQFDRPPENARENRIRMTFGIQKFDEMLHGGIPSGSAVALLGAPGSGKTTLGLKFLVEGAKEGQKGTYFGFYEPPPRIMEKARTMGLPLEEYVDSGLIELIWQPPLERYMDSLAEQLLEEIKENSKDRRRLFIDGIEGFRAAAVYEDRIPRFLSAFANQLRMLDVTTLFSEELPLFQPEVDMPTPTLANVVESVILLRYVELDAQLHRLISIMKMRESAYDTSIREFKIGASGFEVAESFATAEQILTGHARPKRENR